MRQRDLGPVDLAPRGLTALGQPEELRSHIAGALNVGISREEIVEVIMHTSIYAGVPAAGSAMRVAAEVLGTD